MAKIIKVKNPQLPQKEETVLTAKYSSGTTLTVKNNQGYAADVIVIAGYPGDEKTEQQIVATVSGATTITIDAALKFSHAIDTPLFMYSYNQISLERKASGGAWAQIAEGLVDIQWDEKDGFTKISVAAGVDSDTYRWRFYNSATTTYSDYSGELAGTGLTHKQAGYMIEVVRSVAKIPANLGIDDLWLLRSFNRGQRQVDTMHDRWFFALVDDDASTRIQAEADVWKYDLPDTFRAMDVVQVLDTNSQRYNLSYIPSIAFDKYKIDTSAGASSDATVMWTLLPPDSSNTVGYFGVHPTPDTTTNYFYRRYWRFLPDLTTFASSTLLPLPETLINWALFEIYKLREDRDNAMFYYQQFLENINMLRRLQRRQVGQSQLFRFRGQRAFQDMFGSSAVPSNTDWYRENYW